MSIPFGQPSHRSRSRFAPFCQGAKRFAAKGAIEAAGGAGQVMAVDSREVARRKSFHGAVAWMPRLRCLKADAMLPAAPPCSPGPADCRGASKAAVSVVAGLPPRAWPCCRAGLATDPA